MQHRVGAVPMRCTQHLLGDAGQLLLQEREVVTVPRGHDGFSALFAERHDQCSLLSALHGRADDGHEDAIARVTTRRRVVPTATRMNAQPLPI